MGQKRKAVTKDTVEANVTARGAEFQAILQDEMHSSMSSTNGEDEFISRTLKDDIASPRSDSSLWEDMSLSQNADTSSTSLKVCVQCNYLKSYHISFLIKKATLLFILD